MKFFLAATVVCLVPPWCQAQEAELPKPTKQHELLKKLVGEWTSVSKTVATGDQPVQEAKGAIKSRMLGGFWLVTEMSAEMGQTKFQAIQTIGYDTKTGKYIGTWVDSMMNHLWQYEGRFEEDANRLVLEAEGPSFLPGGKSARYRDIYEFKSPDLIRTISEVRQGDKWVAFMKGESKRVKPTPTAKR